MRKHYFNLVWILVIVIGITSCSNEENKTQNQVAARPTVPVMANEVQIGNQIWMTKNLNVSRYRNGDPIPQVQDPNQWGSLTTGAWCYYGNNTSVGMKYGKLYNWYAVHDPRGLAPIGWHIPSYLEWNVLGSYLGNLGGGKLKEMGTMHWEMPNTDASNITGFTGLPGGYRYGFGDFVNLGREGIWWSSTELVSVVWVKKLFYGDGDLNTLTEDKSYGFSVRCLRD
ncbi:hypothetical protein G4D82_13310 [Flavobacterium sp. CYK-4]|uniref:fibrobacter succinogenes major paralogous domain-containing protein n=1 Tax=Flavobacterium lotistagni TaxID=2709660 RepID=UPI00140DC9F9|nr:fibrobacter succinogenes major paralogous domain-containing protein [Flavobacterium lotistagni]NHM08203.1 hypothetical protein [Flavobacterium lotistagni]